MRTTPAAVSLAPILLLACSSVSGAGSVQGPGANAKSDEDVLRGSWTHTAPPPPLQKVPLPAPAVTRFALQNGMRIVVIEQHRKPVVAVSLVLPRGALADSTSSGGMTYMAVKLAGDYYEWSLSGEQLYEEKSFRRQVADAGGSARLEIEPDFSLVRVSGYAPDAREYIRMIGEAVARPRHGGRTFTARRHAMLDAIEDLESSDPEAMEQLVANAAFGSGHPYARSPLGTVDSVTPMGIEEVVERQLDVFVPKGATLLVVGDVRPDAVAAAAKAAFGRWDGEPASPLAALPPPTVPGVSTEVGFLERRSASTLLVCATRPLSDIRGSDAALDVLANILGRGPASRLGATLRDRNGLTYWTSARVVRRRHARAFLACSPLKADQADVGVRLFRDVLEQMREAPPTAQEVQRAKAVRLAELDAAYDDVFDTSQEWLRAIALGTGAPRIEEERAEIASVTAADVHKLARTILARGSTRWVVSGDRSAAARAVQGNALGQLHWMLAGR